MFVILLVPSDRACRTPMRHSAPCKRLLEHIGDSCLFIDCCAATRSLFQAWLLRASQIQWGGGVDVLVLTSGRKRLLCLPMIIRIIISMIIIYLWLWLLCASQIHNNWGWGASRCPRTSWRAVRIGKDYYASPTSGEAYRDRRLTTNFELWVEIFCVSTCFHVRIPKPCLSVCLSVRLSVRPSVCPHPEKRNPLSFVNISPTLVIDTSMGRSSRVLHHGNPKIWFYFQKSSKFEIWLLTKSWNRLSFVNISPTLVINTSMERSSRVLHHGNPKIWFFFQKSSNYDFWRTAEITLASSISVIH